MRHRFCQAIKTFGWEGMMAVHTSTRIKKLLLAFVIIAGSGLSAEGDLPLYYWDARLQQGFSNFGDALSEAIVERMIGHKVEIVADPFSTPKKLLGIGSIL